MFVKVCGITNRVDAEAAVELGATALGFNFYRKSPRYADPASPGLDRRPAQPHIWKVGVFVNEDPAAIRRIATQLKLDIVQLHGDEQPAACPRDLRVWKAIRVDYAFDASRVRKYPAAGRPFCSTVPPGKPTVAVG